MVAGVRHIGDDLRKHSTDLFDKLELTRGIVLEKQGRVPIGRSVLLDSTRRAIASLQVVVVGVHGQS